MAGRRRLTSKQKREMFAKEIERKGAELFIKENIGEKMEQTGFGKIREVIEKKLFLKEAPKGIFTHSQEKVLSIRARELWRGTADARFINMADEAIVANSMLIEAKPKTKRFNELLRKRNKLLREFNELVDLYKVPESYKKKR